MGMLATVINGLAQLHFIVSSIRRLTGALACVVVGVIGSGVSALVVGGLLVLVLMGVIVAELSVVSRRSFRW